MFVAGSLGAVIIWFLRRGVPESPRWLETVGRVAEADAITRALEQEAEHAGPLPAPVTTGPVQERRASFAAIVSPEYRRRTVMLSVLQVLQAFGYYGFGTLVPTVLAAKGYSVVTSLTFTSLTFLGYPFGSALSLPMVERIDRRWLIAISAGLMSVFGLSLGFATSSAAILAAGFLYTTSSNIFSNALHIFQVEIFPTFVRATAAGTAYGMSRLSTAVVPFLLVPVLDRWGAGTMFACIALAL